MLKSWLKRKSTQTALESTWQLPRLYIRVILLRTAQHLFQTTSMLPSLQPTRPKPIQATNARPLQQQQIRHNQQRPQSQIEAMPPDQAPFQPRTIPAMQTFNSAVTHPVFFTGAWRKPPFQLPVNSAFSPVATGYVFGDSKRKDTLTKL